jgi:hypothetical protein
MLNRYRREAHPGIRRSILIGYGRQWTVISHWTSPTLSSQKLQHEMKMHIEGRMFAEQYLHSLQVPAYYDVT